MQGGGNKAKIPKAPDFQKLQQYYKKFTNLQASQIPKQINTEVAARNQADPQFIAHQQALQNAYGPIQALQQRKAFEGLDPQGAYSRSTGLTAANANLAPSAFESRATNDLKSGFSLPPDFATELENNIRGAQAASGNTTGNAAVSAEAIYKGKNALDLYQQRMQNALQAAQIHTGNIGAQSNYLANTPGPLQASTMIQPVASDRSPAFVNPNAGYQGVEALQNLYANQVGAAGAANAGGGSSTAGTIGSILQTVGPILASVAFSDRRLKTDIRRVGRTPGGSNVYSFKYKSPETLYGVMADEMERRNPDAVITHPSGYKMVRYDMVT